jgi:hypothetical protein
MSDIVEFGRKNYVKVGSIYGKITRVCDKCNLFKELGL